jgi:hypothetical protein
MITSLQRSESAVNPTRPSAPDVPSVERPRPDLAWDALLVCVAGYLLMSVGRVHQLFSVLEPLRPATVTGGLALLLYIFDRYEQRRWSLLWVPTTKYLIALLAWMILSVPGSLYEGHSFELVFGNFIKTALMYCVTAAAVRGTRDVERLAFAYLIAAATYAAVVIARFDLGPGEDWRLGHLYYYSPARGRRSGRAHDRLRQLGIARRVSRARGRQCVHRDSLPVDPVPVARVCNRPRAVGFARGGERPVLDTNEDHCV